MSAHRSVRSSRPAFLFSKVEQEGEREESIDADFSLFRKGQERQFMSSSSQTFGSLERLFHRREIFFAHYVQNVEA